jgi:lipid-A-disaccharide synthase
MTEKIFIIAGEISGDILGGPLMQDLKAVSKEPISFEGIGGAQMTEQGLTSLFPMSDLSIMGLAEVIKHLPKLIRRIDQTVKAILTQNPDVLVTIDAPDFCLRVARKIKKLRPEIKIVHYVAPTVWAWRPGRAKKIAKFLDGILCLFPFEPPYFEKHGLKAEFVGHSMAKIIPEFSDAQKQEFYTKYHLDSRKPILCVLPGSRIREIESLKPLMADTLAGLRETLPDVQVIIPTMEHLLDYLTDFDHDAQIIVPQSTEEKYLAFASSTAALHASGTVALELALCKTPMVTVYKINPLTAAIAKRLITTPYANLVNILLRRMVVPELIQVKAVVENVVPAVMDLLIDHNKRDEQLSSLVDVKSQLQENTPQSAAKFILQI